MKNIIEYEKYNNNNKYTITKIFKSKSFTILKVNIQEFQPTMKFLINDYYINLPTFMFKDNLFYVLIMNKKLNYKVILYVDKNNSLVVFNKFEIFYESYTKSPDINLLHYLYENKNIIKKNINHTKYSNILNAFFNSKFETFIYELYNDYELLSNKIKFLEVISQNNKYIKKSSIKKYVIKFFDEKLKPITEKTFCFFSTEIYYLVESLILNIKKYNFDNDYLNDILYSYIDEFLVPKICKNIHEFKGDESIINIDKTSVLFNKPEILYKKFLNEKLLLCLTIYIETKILPKNLNYLPPKNLITKEFYNKHKIEYTLKTLQ